MAFGNYSYNPYVNPYMSAYNAPQQTFAQPMQIPNQMPQLTQNAQQPSQNGFVWVDGIEEANSFYVAPNNAVQLWDKNAPTIYKKSADSTGKPTMQIFDLVERKNESQHETRLNCDLSDFVSNDEFIRLEKRVAALEAKKAVRKEKEAIEDA